MPTVPNWIGHAVVIIPSGTMLRPDEAVAVKSWRATTTQVVVTLDNPKRTELRFTLDGLRGIGDARGCQLLNRHDERTTARVARIRVAEAVAGLESMMATARIDYSRDDAEELFAKISRIQHATTRALAALADVL